MSNQLKIPTWKEMDPSTKRTLSDGEQVLLVHAGMFNGGVVLETYKVKLEIMVRINPGQTGSKVYTWSKDNERVLCDRKLVIVDQNGQEIIENLSPSYREF